MKNHSTQVAMCDLSTGKYSKYQNLARAKSWNLSVDDTDDVFQELCEGAVRAVRRGTHSSLDEALNSQVYWRTASKCKRQRAASRSLSIEDPAVAREVNHSTSDDMQPSPFDEVDDRLVAEIREANIAEAIKILESTIPNHLMRVPRMKISGMTRKQIATDLNTAEGNIQYHWEEFCRRARTLLASVGISSIANLEVANLRVAA